MAGWYQDMLESQSRRSSADVQRQALLQAIQEQQQQFEQQQQERQRSMQGRKVIEQLLPQLMQLGAPPGQGAQPPAPGQPSVPMAPPPQPQAAAPQGAMGQMPPPPGVGFATPPKAMPAPPPQAAAPGAPPGGMPGMPPPPGAQPMAGPPGAPPAAAAPPMPPQGWQGLPKPPAPPAAGPGGLPPPPEDAVMPRQQLSVGDLAKFLDSKGIKGADALAAIEQWKPYMDSQNKSELDAMKLKNTAQTAALAAYQRVLRDAETARHHGALERQGADKIAASKAKAAAAASSSEGVSERYKSDPEYKKQVDFWAKLLQSGQSLPPRFAQSGAGKKMYGDIIAAVPGLGSGNPADIAAGKLNQREMTAEAQKLGTQAASVAIANKELMRFIPLAEKAIDAVPRTEWRPINQIMQGAENTWSPEQKALVIANRSVQNAFAQLIQRGAPTVHSLGEAEKLLNTADSPAVYKAAMKQLRLEGEQADEGLKDAHEDLMKRARGTSGSERPDRGGGEARKFKTKEEAIAAGVQAGDRVEIGGITGTMH